MRKVKHRRALNDFKIIEIFADDTPESRQSLEAGLKILAGIIARSILSKASMNEREEGQIDAESNRL